GEALVLAGSCYEGEFVPYKALDRLVDNLHRHLRGLPDTKREHLLPPDFAALMQMFEVLADLKAVPEEHASPRGARDGPARRRLGFQAFRELLARLAGRQPLVFFIDDLQWGDADSAAFLRDLISSREPLPFLFLFAYRTEEARSSPALK